MNPSEIKTPKELYDFLSQNHNNSKERKNNQPLRYVMYLRKSTDEANKQQHSLEDQEKDCMDMVYRENLLIVDPKNDIIRESRSAKSSENRPLFTKMISDIKNGKYDAIIAWHPNRLSRNMKEAGEIIELLDSKTIGTLKFPTFSFINDSSGKMVLGLTFVLSKQYSDNLSESVSRGNKYRVEEGKLLNKSKHGYIKVDGFLRPDRENFTLIQEAFRMRVNGETLDSIALFLNKNNYSRRSSIDSKEYIKGVTKQKIAKIFADPVYAGVLVYGKQIVDLTEKYDFQEAVSVEDFMKINQINYKKDLAKFGIKSVKRREKVLADLLRGKVFCSSCGDPKSSGISTVRNTNYFYYRCDNSDCPLYNKSTRAKVIIDFVKKYLSQKPFSSLESYEHYKNELQVISQQKITEARNKMIGLKRELENLLAREQLLESALAIETDKEMIILRRNDLVVTKKTIISTQNEIVLAEEILNNAKPSVLTYQDFLETLEKSNDYMNKLESLEDFDKFISKIFSNFIVTRENVVNYTLNRPFDRLEDNNIDKVSLCAG